MAAPSGTVWGEIKGGYSAYPTSYGRLGIYVEQSNSNTQTTATVQIWFWSKYGVNDTTNTLYYDNLSSSGSATTSKGSKTVRTTVSSGEGWSTTNQVKIYEYEHAAYTRGTSAAKRYLYAKLSNVDAVGTTIFASTTFNIPALASYSIQYNANGGSGAPSAQTKFYGKNLTLSSTKPTRTGYSFQGWATSASGSVAYAAGANYTANAAVTLYAVWKANTYAVTYNANGGSLGNVSNQTKTYGVTLKLDADKPTRANYNFVGWATSAGSNTVAYAAGANYTQNAAITLYAIWELAYTKPRITNISLTRCDASGTEQDDGIYAKVSFNWACDYAAKYVTVYVTNSSNDYNSWDFTPTSATTSGSVNQVIGDENFSFPADQTFAFEIVVEDSNDLNSVPRTLNGKAFPIDAIQTYEGSGAAFGKPAELPNTADFNYEIFARKIIKIVNDLSIVGVGSDGKIYSALIPVSASDNTSLGYGLYKAGKGKTHIYGNKVHFYTNDGIYTNGSNIILNAEEDICGIAKAVDGSTKKAGDIISAFEAQNASNNTVIGYGNYDAGSGNTNIYGHDLNFGVSNIASPGTFRPYRRQGDTLTITFRTAGFVTSSGTQVGFTIPFAVPIVGSPTITISGALTLRQGDKYTHGSSASVMAAPNSWSITRMMFNGLSVVATFSNTANVTNNDAIGIYFDGTITLS